MSSFRPLLCVFGLSILELSAETPKVFVKQVRNLSTRLLNLASRNFEHGLPVIEVSF